jgi:hypothetical protein
MKTFAVHFVAIAGQQAGPGGARRKAISVFTKSGPRWKPKTNIVMPSSPCRGFEGCAGGAGSSRRQRCGSWSR